MASSGPGGSSGGATGTLVGGRWEPIPDENMVYISDYDVQGIIAMLAAHSHCSLQERIELVRKNRESFRKFPKEAAEGDKFIEYDNEVDVDEDEDEDNEVDEVEEGEKGESDEIPKLMVDDKKLATDGQRQVPGEDERECKKPRFAEGFGCQGEA